MSSLHLGERLAVLIGCGRDERDRAQAQTKRAVRDADNRPHARKRPEIRVPRFEFRAWKIAVTVVNQPVVCGAVTEVERGVWFEDVVSLKAAYSPLIRASLLRDKLQAYH